MCFAEDAQPTSSSSEAPFSNSAQDNTRDKVLNSVSDSSLLAKLNSNDYLKKNSVSTCLGTVSDIVDNSEKIGSNLKYSEGIDGLFRCYVPQNDAVNMSDMNTGNTDKGTLNLQYMNLVNSYTGQYSDIKMMKGKAPDCESLFQQTYGDLENQIQLSDPQIPESFNPTNMLQDASQSIQQTYGSATSGGTFSTVKNNLSIGDCFAQAKQQLSMPSLYSKGTMKSYLNKLSSGNKQQMQNELKGYNVKGKAIKDSTDKSWMKGLSSEIGIAKQEYNASPNSLKHYLTNDQGTTSNVPHSHYQKASAGLYNATGKDMQQAINHKRNGFINTYENKWFDKWLPYNHHQNNIEHENDKINIAEHPYQ